MAQYYHPRRATLSSATSESRFLVPSSRDVGHRYGSDVQSDDVMMSSSILVFPNPPSEQETSRTESHFEFTGSTPSLPTDVSLGSLRSASWSRSGENDHENEQSWHNLSRSFPLDWDEVVPEDEWEWEMDVEDLRRWDTIRWANHPPRRPMHARTPSNVSLPSTGSPSLAPQPPFRLPLLSCLRTFLNVDESTLHLLSRSPDSHTSVLFPFPPSSSSPSYDDSEEEPLHGARKLLLHNPDKPKNSALIKTGMDPSEVPAEANPVLVSPTKIPVWRFLEFVIEGGVRAWKEVQVWRTGGEARLVGV